MFSATMEEIIAMVKCNTMAHLYMIYTIAIVLHWQPDNKKNYGGTQGERTTEGEPLQLDGQGGDPFMPRWMVAGLIPLNPDEFVGGNQHTHA